MKKFLKSFAIFIVLLFGFFLYATSNNVAGLHSFIVKSGSMEPTIATGALVVTAYAQPNTLQKGDVITFIRPTQERDFITHRIAEITNRNDYISIKTKGDNNPTIDSWLVGGGNVVGKVNFSVPYLGYVLSFVQSKIGILLFILIPSIFILVEEIANIIKLFKREKIYATETVETAVLLLAMPIGLSAISVSPTHALLTDTAQLRGNTFTVALASTPTATPQPTGTACGGNTTINVSNNGAGSTNNVSVTNNCTTTVNQSSSNTSKTTIFNSTSTGSNSVSYSSQSTSISTGSVTSTIISNITGSSGSALVR